MNSKLLNFIDDIVNERLTLLEERKTDESWKNEDKDLKNFLKIMMIIF